MLLRTVASTMSCVHVQHAITQTLCIGQSCNIFAGITTKAAQLSNTRTSRHGEPACTCCSATACVPASANKCGQVCTIWRNSHQPTRHLNGCVGCAELAQDHTGAARGYAPYINEASTYPVYRNVRSYNAVGDGNTDDTNALQKAINAISAGPDPNSAGTRYQNEVTTRPALVFVPGGTYKLTKPLDMRLNTILVGDPLNRPIFKASSNFNGATLINGNDYATNGASGTTNFFIGIKNIIIDTTLINPNTAVVALTWGVAQACQLTNIKIQMPSNSGGHVGIDLNQGSTISVSDIVSFLYDQTSQPMLIIFLFKDNHWRCRRNPQQ